MVYRLSDGKTLIALHHNRAVMRSVYEPIHSQWATMPAPHRGGDRFAQAAPEFRERLGQPG